jgi:hypothetical protein
VVQSNTTVPTNSFSYEPVSINSSTEPASVNNTSSYTYSDDSSSSKPTTADNAKPDVDTPSVPTPNNTSY